MPNLHSPRDIRHLIVSTSVDSVHLTNICIIITIIILSLKLYYLVNVLAWLNSVA